LLLLLLLALPSHAQRLGSINGTVYSASKSAEGAVRGPGIEGARVVLVGTTFLALTNRQGEFAFNGLTPGKYVIQASAIGFATLSSPIEVKSQETLLVEFESEAESVRLPELSVDERPNLPDEFVRRSTSGRGRYFSRKEIEQRHPQTVADLLRTVPGMRVDCRGPQCRVSLMRSPRTCPPAFWVDGVPADPLVVWMQPPMDLDGVEVYSGPSETPPELEHHASCGAIALWTRTPPKYLGRNKKPKAPPPVKADTVLRILL
jgi:hypothetical protein